MKRLALLIAFPLLLTACNVERDPGNETTAITVNEQRIERTVDEAGDVLANAGEELRQAADNARPAIENAARDVGAAADRAGNRIEAEADSAARDVREDTRDNPPPTGNRQ